MIDEHFVELVQAFAFGVKVGAVSVGVPVIIMMVCATIAIKRITKNQKG